MTKKRLLIAGVAAMVLTDAALSAALFQELFGTPERHDRCAEQEMFFQCVAALPQSEKGRVHWRGMVDACNALANRESVVGEGVKIPEECDF